MNFGIGRDADQWDLAVSRMLYFANVLINILTSILQSLYGPNHQGRHKQHTDEREKTNHLILYYNVCAPEYSC